MPARGEGGGVVCYPGVGRVSKSWVRGRGRAGTRGGFEGRVVIHVRARTHAIIDAIPTSSNSSAAPV